MVTVVVVLMFFRRRKYTQAKQDGKYFEQNIFCANVVLRSACKSCKHHLSFITFYYQTAQDNEEEVDYTDATFIPHKALDAVRYFCYSLY